MFNINETGLYWHPLGGNNIDQYSGHCYHYFCVEKKMISSSKTSIIVDVGKFDNYAAFGIENACAAIPDIRFLLSEKDAAKAIFITHSHPDHLNGILHYIKAGYKLPPLYATKYTFMILTDLLKQFNVDESDFPVFNIIKDGDIIKIENMEIEAIAASHTCFGTLGFIIRACDITLYHTGDMKIDQSTYFRKPTNIRRLKELKDQISHVVADFCQIYQSGKTPKELDSFNKIVSIIQKSRKKKIFIPVYPTHPEMYLIAFLSALKTKKNVIFYGNKDFYTYLNLIIEYGISFSKLAKDKIKVKYKLNDEIEELDDNYVVIGTFNDLPQIFRANDKNSFGIITQRNFFSNLRNEMERLNIKYVDNREVSELQAYGHGFVGDYEELNKILERPIFIPTHCPAFVVDNFRELAQYLSFRLIDVTPNNNSIFKISPTSVENVFTKQPLWLIVTYEGEKAILSEVFQTYSAGKGNIRSTASTKKNIWKINSYLSKFKKGN